MSRSVRSPGFQWREPPVAKWVVLFAGATVLLLVGTLLAPGVSLGPMARASPPSRAGDAALVADGNNSTSRARYYPVLFVETGAPANSTWAVTLGPFTMGTNVSALSFNMTNGTYHYTVSDVIGAIPSKSSGNLTVRGAGLNLTLQYIAPPAGMYPAWINATGAPAATSWSASLNGSVAHSVTRTVLWYVPNGSYVYSILAPVGYNAIPSGGNLSIRGAGANATVAFTVLSHTYVITFRQTGLPSGTDWWVDFNGTTRWSNNSTMMFSAPNDSYAYQVAASPGYAPAPTNGSLTVHGPPGTQGNISVTFLPFPTLPKTYRVMFTESGLANGTSWSLALNKTKQSSTSATISFNATDGRYPYTIDAVAGYTLSTPATGNVTVLNAAVNVSVNYTPAAGMYRVTFNETGLPNGTSWSITLAGKTTGTSTTTSITMEEKNGTYSYAVGSVSGYNATPKNGTVQVNGTGVNRTIAFSAIHPPLPGTFTIRFQENGLANGTRWVVTLDGVSHNATTDAIMFNESNGTYAYTISDISGYSLNVSSGALTVAGLPQVVNVGFSRTSSPATGLAAVPYWAWILIAIIIILVIIGAVAAAASRRRPPRTVSSTTVTEETTSTGAGSPPPPTTGPPM